MNYAAVIPEDLMRGLLLMLEAKLEGHTIVAQNFIIQYTYFEFEFAEVIKCEEEDNDWADDQQAGLWVMKTFLDIGSETLTHIYLSVSSNNNTRIAVYGRNPNFGVLKINKKLDMRNRSVYNKIYACDLYTDFEPLHYYGKCYTR